MLLITLSVSVLAGDIYMREGADGSISFTDTPDPVGFTLFLPDGPPPLPAHVNLNNFPRLDEYDLLFLEAEGRYGLEAELIKAVCLAESGMNPLAVSKAGAQGLMQLMPETALGLGVSDSFEPVQAIPAGARYLAEQLQRFGSQDLALAAYNAGPGNVEHYGGIPPFEETQVYVQRVNQLYNLLRLERPIQSYP